MALRALIKADPAKAVSKSSVATLYRSMIREIPRVLVIYDIDMPHKIAKNAIAWHFRRHADLKDSRVIGTLIAKGYMELEETLLQWKQKTHLLRILENPYMKPKKDYSDAEKLVLGVGVY